MVGFTLVMQFLAMGTGFYVFSVLLVPLTEALQADRFLVSLALSLQTLFGALVSPWVGKMVAERSVRGLMWAGAGLMGIGFFMLSQTTALWQLFVSFGLMVGAGVTLTGALPCNALLTNWFFDRRGTALGISQFGITISGTVLVPLASHLVLNFGWQSVPMTFAIAIPVIMIPLTWKFAVKCPEDMGLYADGAAAPPVVITGDAHSWTFTRALRDPQVRLLALLVGPPFMGIGTVVLGMHSHATDTGLSVMQASSVVAFMTACGAAAKPLFGMLADRFDKRWAMAISLCCQLGGLALIILLDSYVGLILAGCLFGLGYGGIMPLWTVLIATFFGREAFARVMGLMFPMTVPFTLAGLPFATFMFETTGSYIPAFTILLTGFAGALFVLWRLPMSDAPR